ncbi:MAG: LPS export ABC transporter ATP-binding protein [Bacteriovoracaceae bacterium]|nr:LPS export ABC transporter ATP-binding protein [Bacteriovoracaceae bacterium]
MTTIAGHPQINEKIFVSENLQKTYNGRKVVNGVGLSIKTGQIVGLLGPNGAGKTTTFYMMVGLVKPDHGEIRLDQEIITDLPLYERARRGIGYLPQEASIFRDLTVEDNIMAVLEMRSLSAKKRVQRLEELLTSFHVTHIRKSKGRSLSGGERRRVEIARTLALSPFFILLDEPFAGVDPVAVGDIKNIISKLRDIGMGVLITDHNVRETLTIVDHAYIMNKGELLVDGTPEFIVTNEEAKKVYLGDEFKM